MKKHRNIPIFVPHLGCPNTCVFCNQRKISGCQKADFSSVEKEIEEALATIPLGTEVQIAFFGGSFTGIDRADMLYLLKTAKKYIDAGKVESIRLSTRPDYIDEEILDILSEHGVKTIELGIQSMSDDVLKKSGRGHTAGQTEKACRLICERMELFILNRAAILGKIGKIVYTQSHFIKRSKSVYDQHAEGNIGVA